MIITPFLKLAADKQASDLFFSAGAPVNIKINGVVMPVNAEKLKSETIERIAYEIMTPEQIATFESSMEMNFPIASWIPEIIGSMFSANEAAFPLLFVIFGLTFLISRN